MGFGCHPLRADFIKRRHEAHTDHALMSCGMEAFTRAHSWQCRVNTTSSF